MKKSSEDDENWRGGSVKIMKSKDDKESKRRSGKTMKNIEDSEDRRSWRLCKMIMKNENEV